MNTFPSPASAGRVASIHLHPAAAGAPLQDAEAVELVADKGIKGEPRYFGRRNRAGQVSRRQVTLIERERIEEHSNTLGLGGLAPGEVRSNIETSGINLVELVGQQVQAGSAILYFYEPRTPCAKMDALAPGLRALMENGRQGVLAEVVQSGRLAVGDAIKPLGKPA